MTQFAVRTSRPTPLLELFSPAGLVRSLARHRDLITQFGLRDTTQRHKGTYLGVAWAVGQPLLQLAVYTFIFTKIFPSKWSQGAGGGEYSTFALNFFAGALIFTVFSECVTRAPTMVLERPNLVQKVVFPLHILPVAAFISALIYGLVSAAILIVAAAVLAGTVSRTMYWFPLVLVPLTACTLGVSWFLAALGVFIRDVRQVVIVVVQLLYFATPIFYPLSAVKAQLPGAYLPFVYLNPLTPIVEDTRRTLLLGERPDLPTLGVVTLISLVVMQLGYAFFMKTRRGFADVL